MKRALFVAGFVAGALAGLVGGIAFAVSVVARAEAELQLEYGQCRFGEAKDGTYYDSRFQHRNYLTPRCASIGVAGKLPAAWLGKAWGYRVAYVQSGTVEGRDNLAEMNDGVYNPHPCSNDHWANCHSLFGGAGRMRGVSVSITRAWAPAPDWQVIGEVGALFFEHYFNGYAKPVDFDGEPMVRDGHVRGTSTRWEDAGLNQQSGLLNNPLPIVGVTLRYGAAYFALRYHVSTPRAGLSITDHSFLQLMGGVSIPLGGVRL